MAKHTPGEWTLQGSTVRSGEYIIHDPPGSPEHPQLKADSQLIAAAPDLLSVAKQALDQYEFLFPQHYVRELKAALKKARGET
jgi:hypothetical protein